jgi:RimJ/RimL family protein N-acetyltransferase
MEDVDDVHHLHSLPQTDKYNTLGIPEHKIQTEKLVAEWLSQMEAKTKYIFVIENRQSEFAGVIGMNIGRTNFRSAEIWYKIDLNYWGKGFATDATKLLLAFGFNDLKLHRIEAGCATGNTASAKVLEKCGFIKEGMSRKILPIRGEWKDGYRFAILEEDWKV